MRRTWFVAGALALTLGALAACGSSGGNGGGGVGAAAGTNAAVGGSTSSSGTGSVVAGSSGETSSGGTSNAGATASGGSTSSAGMTSAGGTSSGGVSSGPVTPAYWVTTASEWDTVFNTTGHDGDGFQWVPLGIRDRQGLGTASTSSVILFNDSDFAGHFFNSTAGQYAGITADAAKISWLYGTNAQKGDFKNIWDTTHSESGYSGTVPWNLVNNYGMSGIRGTSDTHDTDSKKMWSSDHAPSSANSYVILDAYGARKLGNLYLWNFNEGGNSNKGLKNIKVFTSTDGNAYAEFTGSGYPFQIPQAKGSGPSSYNQVINLNGTQARYVKLTYNPVSGDGNWGAPDMYGLSAVRIYDTSNDKLVLSAKAGSTASRNAYGGDPWNMAAFSLGNYVYFVLHNAAGCCTPFEANATQLMRYTVTNGNVDWTSLVAFDSLPYMYYPAIPGGFSPQPDDARVGDYYQVVQFENLAFWNDDDGYIYMLGADESNQYGVWNDKSKIVLSRVSSGSFEDLNARQYWNGTSWVQNYETATDLKDISGNPIYPVGNMPGYFKAQGGILNGKYVLVYMEGVSASSYFRYADNPWGPWSDKYPLFLRLASDTDTVYNTGAVPFLSNPGGFDFYAIRNGHGMQFFKYAELGSPVSASTGFESGDALPTYKDALESSSNISGYQAGINPECSLRTGEQHHTGNAALLFSGSANGGATTNAYYDVFTVNLPISSTTVLDYWIYPQQDNGRYVAVDFHCTDGSTLAGSGAVDQNGASVDPKAGHGGNIPLNAWSEIKANVGAKLAGKIVDKIWVAYDRAGSSGQYHGYIDDL
ncbi:MAG TPA: DUF4185 domain-containing protein, partial [Polyangiaceae bacterium]|nr:DUF4185 domain-containing protein [Polyangiaceae bacterium]